MAGKARAGSHFNVLIVCTGNICRSPLAEQALRQMLSDAAIDRVTVASAGTAAEVSEPMHELSVRSLAELGFTPEDHVARQLDANQISQADLVLTATVPHRSQVVAIAPAASSKTFTLREFQRIANFWSEREIPELPNETLTPVQKLARFRGYAPPAEEFGDDIGDPWGQSYEIYQLVGQQIAGSLEDIVEWLGGNVGNK